MRITKDEKTLYKFLDIVNKIIGRSTGRSYIVGNSRSLFFSTQFYCGMFSSHEDYQGLLNPYDFGICEYELKKLPNGTYVLDKYEPVGNTVDTIRERDRVVENIVRCTDQDQWCCEIDKTYENKIAKIASTTQKWIADDDLYILKSFDSLDICTNNNGLVIRNLSSVAEIYIAFSDVIVSPEGLNDNVQMKIEAYDEPKEQTDINEPIMFNEADRASYEQDMKELEYDDPMA